MYKKISKKYQFFFILDIYFKKGNMTEDIVTVKNEKRRTSLHNFWLNRYITMYCILYILCIS